MVSEKATRMKSRTRSLGSRNDADLFLSFSLSLLKRLRPMKQFYDANCYCKTDYAQDDIVFMKVNKATLNMLVKVDPYIMYGYPNLKTVRFAA